MRTYGDGKAGQWARRQSERRVDRMLVLVVAAGMGSGGAIGLIVGAFLSPGLYRHIPTGAAWAMPLFAVVAMAGVSAAVLRAIRRPLHELGRERVKHLHGAQAEALVAYNLRSLGDRWHLFNGVATSGGGDVDHVLVGPAGVYSVSTKSHRGLYGWAAGSATLNGRATDHVVEAQRSAMQLRHWLEARLRPEHGVRTVPFVHPVLCVPLAAVEVPVGATRVRLVDAGELYDLLNEGKPVLSDAQVRGVVAVLCEITGRQEREAAA